VASDTPTIDSDAVHAYVEGYLPEEDALVAARRRADQLGAGPLSPGSGSALRFLATALQAKAVVEVGTGAGVSGLYLLRGMAADGVLTSIDVDPERQTAAKRAFSAAGVAPGRTRLIMGRALDVLPRLTDEAYDLLFVDAAKPEYPSYHQQGVRLLRPGGVIAFDNINASLASSLGVNASLASSLGNLPNPARRDTETTALREVARAVRDDDRLVPVLLPLGDGLLVAAKV
jgi:predicted O-methyltransferase YrrM